MAAQSVTEMMTRVADLAAQSNKKAGLLSAEAEVSHEAWMRLARQSSARYAA